MRSAKQGNDLKNRPVLSGNDGIFIVLNWKENRIIMIIKIVISKEYLKRLSVKWSSPLSDVNKVTASNQFALPVLSYLMPTQRWPMSALQKIDREVRKVIYLVIFTKSS